MNEQGHVDTHLTVIEPIASWGFIDMRELARYRDLLYFMIWRSIKVAYAQSIGGIAWAMVQPALQVIVFSLIFGGLLAVDEVSLDVQEHDIVSIIGPNGAGKTTVFNCMSGFYKPTGGKILFEGKEVQGKPDYKISRL
ncbi:MAG: ATP-binding cassette domain-containing protein, partial [Gammaproteobacteria bacterium]|nr:ATP-binding cassette domain-containing protein [Gammaproteobacteria bacterium]